MESLMGWLGNILILIGCLQLGYKKRIAFLYSAVGNLLWAIYGIWLSMPDLWVLSIVFVIIALRNWWLWTQSDEDI